MGIERSVTRWYMRQQSILGEIAVLKEQLRNIPVFDVQENTIADARNAELLLQLEKAREKLSSLGPSPKPMMG